MRNMLKNLSLLLALLMLATVVLAGCGASSSGSNSQTSTETATSIATTQSTTTEASKPDTSQYVELKYYDLGDKAKDTDLVLEQVNKKLKDTINATLNVQYISWGDWATKYPLIFASGDEFDGILSASWSFYATMAKKNGFLELTPDLLNKYTPGIMQDTPQSAWNATKVDGKIYMIPQGRKEYGQRMYIVRGDLRSKYNLPEIKTFDNFTTYLKTIAKNEKDMVAYGAAGSETFLRDLFMQWNELDSVNGLPLGMYNITDPESSKIVSLIDVPEFADYLNKIKELKDAGCWSKSALTSKVSSNDAFINGKSAATVYNMMWTNDNIYVNWKTAHPDWKLEVFDGTEGKKVQNYSPLGGGVSVHATSKNVERFLMAVEILKEDKATNDLINNGIEGTHWDTAGGNKIKLLPNSPNYTSDALTWVFRTAKYQTFPEDTYSNYNDLFDSLKSREVFQPLQSFNFDITNFKNENAAVTNVISQYLTPLELGFISDPAKGLETLKQKLNEAGYNKMLEACQQQADAYMKTVK